MDTCADTREAAIDRRDGPGPLWSIHVVWSPDAGARGLQRVLEGALSVGRSVSERDQLRIRDQELSREHAVVSVARGAVSIEDRGSRNGTFVDGERVEERTLDAGSVVRVGNSLLMIERLDPRVAAIPAGPLCGRAPAFLAAVAAADRVAGSSLAVLLLGETGTGKELFARRIHERSGVRGGFVAINCAAIPSELLESSLFGHKKGAFTGAERESAGLVAQADGGTLFLDEIGEMPLELQAKMLRVLESRSFLPVGGTAERHSDFRVVAATHADLAQRAGAGSFRYDLLARLGGATVRLPSLRERRQDIPLLTEHFLRELAPGKHLEWNADILEELLLSDWPMNVRELRQWLHRTAVVAGAEPVLTAQHFEESRALGLGSVAGPRSVDEEDAAVAAERPPSKEELERVLGMYRGNIARVCEHFGRARIQVYRWMKKHGVDRQRFR